MLLNTTTLTHKRPAFTEASNLITDARRDFGPSYLIIANDLALMELCSDEDVVIFLSGVADSGRSSTMFAALRPPYMPALLDAVPQRGCCFHLRRPLTQDICRVELPAGRGAPRPSANSWSPEPCRCPTW